jgi:hypothetical protein
MWFFRPDLVKEMEEKVQRIIHNLKEAQARQKSYADKRRYPLYFLEKNTWETQDFLEKNF